jgi:hypothetical protein
MSHYTFNGFKLEFFSLIPKWKRMERCLFGLLYFLSLFFQHHIHKKTLKISSTNLHPIYFQSNLNWIGIEYSWIQIAFNVFECNSIKSKFNSNFALKCYSHLNFIEEWSSLSFQEHFLKILVSQGYLSFLYFFNVLNLGANKDDLFHFTHCIIYHHYYLGQNSFISRLFQHYMSLTYEYVLFRL